MLATIVVCYVHYANHNTTETFVAGSNFSYEEVAEVPNVFAAGIALVILTLSCALFICKPLYPITNGLLPYIGSGISLQ